MSKVLIVDDEKQNVDALSRSLGDLNPEWKIMVAANERDAVKTIEEEFLKGEAVDILLTDLVMDTAQSGMRLLAEARRIDPSIMTILFTANEKSLDRYAAFEAGAFDVVEKNILGASAAREINVKTRAALQYRHWFRQMSFAQRYFDPRVFEHINRTPNVLALQNRLVTVAFWDIRGFSLLCEILKGHPDLVAGFLKEYCEAAARTIFENGGVLDKFIGDGVMALFGVLGGQVSEVDQNLAAVRTATTFRKKFAELLAKWTEVWIRYTPQQISIGIGCGIHCGDALVGNVGTSFRDQFTALGSTVNFAARIESKALDGQILVSQSVRARLKDHLSFVQSQQLSNIKNIPGTYTIYELGADQIVQAV